MTDDKKHKFTAKIADAEPIRFDITLDEETIYRKACYHVNRLWEKFRLGSGAQPLSSHDALARVALAFAELYYRKSEQLGEQARLFEEFEAELDKILSNTK